MRLTITEKELTTLEIALQNLETEDAKELNNKLQEQFKKAIKTSFLKRNATAKANEKRTKIAKKKIEKAINFLRKKDKKLTVYAIAKKANVSYTTAKKYSHFD